MSVDTRRLRRRPWWSFAFLAGFSILGCGDADTTSDETPPDYTKVVPATGTVKINGTPLATAVVTFLPAKWSASNGETDENGAFELETAGQPGVLPGEYKVAISYLVSADGEPQGLGPRSALAAPPSMATAREQIPPEYSDFGRTTLKATVPADGGNFDFDLKVDLIKPEPEPAKTEATEPAKTEAAEPAKPEPK